MNVWLNDKHVSLSNRNKIHRNSQILYISCMCAWSVVIYLILLKKTIKINGNTIGLFPKYINANDILKRYSSYKKYSSLIEPHNKCHKSVSHPCTVLLCPYTSRHQIMNLVQGAKDFEYEIAGSQSFDFDSQNAVIVLNTDMTVYVTVNLIHLTPCTIMNLHGGDCFGP